MSCHQASCIYTNTVLMLISFNLKGIFYELQPFTQSVMARRVLHPILHVLPSLRLGRRQQGGAEYGRGHLWVPVSKHKPPGLPARAGMPSIFTTLQVYAGAEVPSNFSSLCMMRCEGCKRDLSQVYGCTLYRWGS